MNSVIFTQSYNPFENLGLEDCLFDSLKEGVCLYLWQNGKTVVIGRHQNPYTECNLKNMEADGVLLARRRSGGGAVYHDLGNLNFTFVADKKLYDKERQFLVVISALKSLGVEAALSGRNDLTVFDKKISGNAFRLTDKVCLHHGTILINESGETLSKYLNVSREKLISKGVLSVKSRVARLTDFEASITAEGVKQALISAFYKEYGSFETLSPNNFDFSSYSKFYADPIWRFGATPPFNVTYDGRFSFGEIGIRLNVVKNQVVQATVYSDGLDVDLPIKIQEALTGRGYFEDDFKAAFEKADCGAADWKLFTADLISQLF